MKVLVTGFDPFGGEQTNPAFEVVKNLPNELDCCDIVKLEVPTIFNNSIQVLHSAIEKEAPDVVICLGQAGGETCIRLEKVAINLDDARIPDNASNQPTDEPISVMGETAYFATLPLKAIQQALNKACIPSVISYSAGTFVCNHLFYGLMDMIQKSHPNIKGGFVHIPYLPEQVIDKPRTPSMSLNTMTEAVKIIIETAIHMDQDIHLAGGTLD